MGELPEEGAGLKVFRNAVVHVRDAVGDQAKAVVKDESGGASIRARCPGRAFSEALSAPRLDPAVEARRSGG